MRGAARGDPSLAVVVPALDEAGRLGALLDSLGWRGERVPAGEDVPEEVVVADGGSADGTPELARCRGATVVEAPRSRGAQLARGVEATTSDVVWILHADTRVTDGSCGAVRRVFRDTDALAAGARQRIEHDARIYRWIERAAARRVRKGCVYGDSGLAVRREAYRAVGGFREHPIFEDLDLSRRLARAGEIRLVEDAVLVVSPRRWQAEGTVRRTVKNWVLTAAWRLGVDPARLVRYYPPHSAAT